MKDKIIIISCLLCMVSTAISVSGQQTKSFKRGLAYNIPYAEDLPTLSKGISWDYNWGFTPGYQIASVFDPYIDYIPMSWSGVDTVQLKTFYSTHPNIKYILGFNEPNFKQQANLTPTQAASKWKLIERIASLYDLKIVGPALNYAPATGAVSENGVTYTDPIKYMDDFIKACPTCKFDYIGVHNYMNSELAVEGNIALYKKYNKPIWLTEFCEYDGTQTLTPDTQKDYMVELLNYLENDPDIYRYSWFIGRNGGGDTAFPYNSLLTNNDRGVLTELGDIYIHMSSFDKSFYFGVTDKIEAEKFSNSHSASLRRTDVTSGNLYLNNFYFKDWATYQINLPEAKEYTITFRIACIDGTTLQILDSNGNLLKSQDMPTTGGLTTWGYRTMTVLLPAGQQTIQLKSMGEGCNLDWFTFVSVDTAVRDMESSVIINLYPNPMGDILNIDTQEGTNDIKIVDTLGKVVFQGTNEKQVNTRNFSKGIYVVQLTFNDGKKLSRKMMK
ncbi:MAG: glycosyl hydrolase [Paludibacter sp.]|nr:glycosyl hydrolase [Paludibacter sp.]